ncbi:uncharacterized protein DDB_G0284459-like [Pieris napi]|uniref:uncharacterized protein DDB_G0284459-like n=1 Tax=Pieris napi TaxID=78633 RepID=UPI001FBAD7A8|nr:uncharacterized protein DDB_G0284459-like [Pieris napi]
MSKQGKRKITVELPKTKDLSNRPSVFERLGTKKASSSGKKTDFCRQWVQHGSCAYGKSCKFASTHTLISPSKQRANKDVDQKRLAKDDPKSRLHSTVVVRTGRSTDGEIDNWDQNDLEYADTDVLEKRRQQLQHELELQLKMDSGKDMAKEKKKAVSSSSSSRSSSSSSGSSSSSDGSSSSSSSGRDAKKKAKKGKLKRNSSSSSDGDVPAKKKLVKSDTVKRDKAEIKKGMGKKEEKVMKKPDGSKKKVITKSALGKKSLSPTKKSGGTPPITSKSLLSKTSSKHGKSPQRRERNRSASPQSSRDREKDKDRGKEKDKERDKDKERRGRSKSPKKARSRSPRRSHPKDTRRKDSSERSRPVSPKKQSRREASTDRHKKRSVSRDRDRRRSMERKKEKHDDKDRHDRKDRGRDRKQDNKRDDKRRGRERGLAKDKGLEKPNKPMQRLLPRPEERLAALAAISNKAVDNDKNPRGPKDQQDNHSERGRKQDRIERDRSIKRDRMDSIDREQGDYDMERPYDHGMDHYDRMDNRYGSMPRDSDRSPGYLQGRDRHYDPGYDMPGPSRYPEDDDRMYGDMGERGDIGYDDRRRDRSWEGRSGSMERDRYMHHKDWDNDDYRGSGDWGRERHWPMHDAQMNDWDKEQDEGWRHRHPGPHRNRMHDDYNRMRMDHGRDKRRRPEPETKEAPPAHDDDDDKPIPDDLSEISDDPDDILERDDMQDQTLDEDSQTEKLDERANAKPDNVEKENTQDTIGACEDKESQDGKDEDDVANLDFEEISDGELEEERTRTGLGDALGVDWASLVADVNRREQKPPTGGARDRWRPERVLARLGLSINMAGKEKVQDILQKNRESMESKDGLTNGKHEACTDVESLHPVGAVQVSMEKRKRQREVLFGLGCEITRGLSARRDLALRRYLCHLPAVERSHSRVTPQPSLFQAARALLEAPVNG